MMGYVMLAFAVTVMLNTFSLTEAHQYNYITVHKEGHEFDAALPLGPPSKRRIPAGQCSGLLEFPVDYKCPDETVVGLPNVLEVTALDDQSSPKITFSDDLGKVTIERELCDYPALILIRWSCLLL